jgi:CBS domain-containing protein
MNVATIIKEKNQETYTCKKEWPVLKCVHLMNEKKIGALVVTGDIQQVEGIITERDVLRLVGECNCIPDDSTVGDVMTSKETLVVARKEDSVERIMDLMTTNRVRHIPIVENGKLAGIVSIGDAVKCMLDMALFENNSIKSYISGM